MVNMTPVFRYLWILLIGLFLTVPVFANLATPPPYILAAGDSLDIRFVTQKTLNTKQAIAPDGSISLPILNRIQASELSLTEFQETLTEAFIPYIKNPQITVFLTPRPIYVMQYDLRRDTWKTHDAQTKVEALALIGPRTDFVIKRNGLVLTSRQLKITQNTLYNSIQHGDVIEVKVGKKPGFFEENWYKLITATAVIIGIFNAL